MRSFGECVAGNVARMCADGWREVKWRQAARYRCRVDRRRASRPSSKGPWLAMTTTGRIKRHVTRQERTTDRHQGVAKAFARMEASLLKSRAQGSATAGKTRS